MLNFHTIKVNARSLTVRALVPPAERAVCPTCGVSPGRFLYGWHYGDSVRLSARGYCSIQCHTKRPHGSPWREIILK